MPSDPRAALEASLPVGRALFALRQILHGTGDAQLALQYLYFHADVNDPQVTPLLERHGVPSSTAPALEDYVCRELRPLMGRIDRGSVRASKWAAETMRGLAAVVQALPGLEEPAIEVLHAELRSLSPEGREAMRVALEEGSWPGPKAERLLGILGILQEGFGMRISFAASSPFVIEKGA